MCIALIFFLFLLLDTHTDTFLNQFGFRKNSSTINAINQVIDIIKSKSSFRFKLLISLDISSAFDSISWSSIINHLVSANVNDEVVVACESLMLDRRVLIGENEYRSSKSVPQGDVASPLLLSIGYNNLLKHQYL